MIVQFVYLEITLITHIKLKEEKRFYHVMFYHHVVALSILFTCLLMFLSFCFFIRFSFVFWFGRSFDDCIVLIICVSWILNYLLCVSDCVVIHFLIIIRVEKLRVTLAGSRPLLYYYVECDERMKV